MTDPILLELTIDERKARESYMEMVDAGDIEETDATWQAYLAEWTQGIVDEICAPRLIAWYSIERAAS